MFTLEAALIFGFLLLADDLYATNDGSYAGVIYIYSSPQN